MGLQIAIVVGFFVVVLLGIRMLPIKADQFHVDPTQVTQRNLAGSTLMLPQENALTDAISPRYALSASELAQKLDTIVSEDGERIAGDLTSDYATYLYRSKIFAFPDYASIKVIDLDDGQSTFAVYSRLRLGKSDMNVNPKRVRGWLVRLREFEIK